MKYINRIFLLLLLTLSLAPLSAHDLKGAVASDDRTPKNMLRDSSRNPVETLSFFGIESDMVVIELSPGGGWYTEILANYIHYPGTLIAAHWSKDSEVAYFRRGRANFEKKMSENPMYGRVEIVDLNSSMADANSVDAVLTFMNVSTASTELASAIEEFKSTISTLPYIGFSDIFFSKFALPLLKYATSESLLQ